MASLIFTAASSVALASDPSPYGQTEPPTPAEAPPAEGPRPFNLGLFAGAGFLGSPGTDGGAILTGARLGMGRHFATSLDFGYGLLGGGPGVAQDRWWVVPAAAAVVSVGHFRFDLGAGAGVGTSSGYSSWSDYTASPFSPVWHFTVPAVRAHTTVAFALNPHLDLFARFDAASLLFARSGEGATATSWFALWIGLEPRLL